MSGERPPEVVGNPIDLMRMMDEMREIHAGIVNELEGFGTRDQITAEEPTPIRDKQQRFEERQQKFEETQQRFDERQLKITNDVDGNHHLLEQNLKENHNMLASKIIK